MESLEQRLPPLTPDELTENSRTTILASNITIALLATLAVLIRFYARQIRPDGYGTDDLLIAAALVVGWGLVGATIAATDYGMGQHWREVLAVDASAVLSEGQAYLASGVLFAVDIMLVKISALILYVRLFGPRRSIVWAAWALGTFTLLWSLIVVIVSLVQCQPIAAIWDPSVEGKCINSWLFTTFTSALNTATDLAILILPLPALLSVRCTKSERFSLSGIFFVGIITCVFSILRLVAIVHSQDTTDPTWTQGMVAIWTASEPCLGILAISLPTFSPFFSRQDSVAEPMTPPHSLLPGFRTDSAASSRPLRRSFDWANIELVKGAKFLREDPAETCSRPMEGVIEVRTTWETRHSWRKMEDA